MANHHLFPEIALQQIWAAQEFEKNALKTICGKPLQIDFAGWHNSANGPDFKEARIKIGNQDYFGSIELHLQSSDWFTHQHHLNSEYNSVVLHVVFFHNGKKETRMENGKIILELELAPLLSPDHNTSETIAKERLILIKDLPGRCGLNLLENNHAKLPQILGHAAEQRIQAKAQILLDGWQEQEPEELLFQHIFKSLGYAAYAQVFEELAKLYPFSELRSYFRQTQRTARSTVLSRWFGACGLFNSQISISDPTIRHEFMQWKDAWLTLAEQPKISHKAPLNHRPQNSAERRLLGMFHHLQKIANEGLLKSWMLILQELSEIADDKDLRKQVMSLSEKQFDTPDWEVWKNHLAFGAKKNNFSAQLVGRDRHIIIWANALIPFFLAYARHEKDLELEKLLYRLFMILPAESLNSKTRFMEKRLWISALPKKTQTSIKTFGNRQALIQIHHDFCRNFNQGCLNCDLPDLLKYNNPN